MPEARWWQFLFDEPAVISEDEKLYKLPEHDTAGEILNGLHEGQYLWDAGGMGDADVDGMLETAFEAQAVWDTLKQTWDGDHSKFVEETTSTFPPELADAIKSYVGDPAEFPFPEPTEVTDEVDSWFDESVPQYAQEISDDREYHNSWVSNQNEWMRRLHAGVEVDLLGSDDESMDSERYARIMANREAWQDAGEEILDEAGEDAG